ncbi:MAG: hypothetical protein KA383_17915 [Phycisphaerae bacterium]|nr:hypothetical protein [Phycisphaerae bacterium]
MSSETHVARRSVVLFTCIVLVLGTVTAGFFGLFAGAAYGFMVSWDAPVFGVIGLCCGAFAGLLAGVAWCWVMIRRARRSSERGLAGLGALVGFGVGVLSTILLHALLMFMSSHADDMVLLIGLGCGAVAGLAVGAICGALLRWFAPAATPPPETPPAVPTGEDEAG